MDAPWRLLSWIDGELLSFLAPALRVVVWAALAAIASMELYRLLSPQERIRSVERELRERRAALDAHEGGFGEGWSIVRDVLRLSFVRVLLVAPATVVAVLPLLALVGWMSGMYGSQRILAFGPSWIGRWEPTFFMALGAVAFTVKSVRRIA